MFNRGTPDSKGLSINPLNINGSTLQTGMDYDVERTNFTGSNKGNTITTNKVVMAYTAKNAHDKGVFFNNINGSWFLADAFNVKISGLLMEP